MAIVYNEDRRHPDAFGHGWATCLGPKIWYHYNDIGARDGLSLFL